MEEKDLKTTNGYDPELIAAKLRRWERYLQKYTLPTWDELPDFELYMDQVIALLDKYLDFLPEEERVDKTVTASAINNYVRLKVMPAPNKKRYSRIHIAYLIMICTLKQTLSIAEVSRVLPVDIPEEQVRTAYDGYVQQHRKCAMQFIELSREVALPIL